MSKSLASALDPVHAPRRGRGKSAKSPLTSAEFARAALGEIEDALDRHGWPWNPQLSLLIDARVILEESSQA